MAGDSGEQANALTGGSALTLSPNEGACERPQTLQSQHYAEHPDSR